MHRTGLRLLYQAFPPCPPCLEPSEAVPSSLHSHPAPCKASRPCRPFLLNQHFQCIGSVSFSFLLPEKFYRHEIIFKETYFHLSSPLRGLGLPHPPSHSQVSSCAPTQHHLLWVLSRTSPIPHTQLLLPSQGADPCLEPGLMSSSALWCCHWGLCHLPLLPGTWDDSPGAVVGSVPSPCRDALSVH